MNIRQIIPALTLGASSLFVSCGGKAPVKQAAPQLAESRIVQRLATDTFSRHISDKNKIIEFNKVLKQYGKSNGNYIIIDKKRCEAYVYSPNGKVLYKSEVALGRNKGDKRGGGYKVKGAKLSAYTTPGEFTICREGTKPTSPDNKLYGNRCLVLGGDHTQKKYSKSQVLALHRVPATPMGKLRENVFNNGTIKDNRVSFGCVNFIVKSFDKMRSLIKGKSTKVYILPEEKGNSLQLEKQQNGTFKFVQTKYKTEAMEHNKK